MVYGIWTVETAVQLIEKMSKICNKLKIYVKNNKTSWPRNMLTVNRLLACFIDTGKLFYMTDRDCAWVIHTFSSISATQITSWIFRHYHVKERYFHWIFNTSYFKIFWAQYIQDIFFIKVFSRKVHYKST